MIHTGDCLQVLQTLPDSSVQCCVTSPPYYGLRDYGTAQWDGGDANCNHVESENKHGGQRADRNQEGYKKLYADVCGKCGAVRVDKQLGLEKTPQEYVDKMVAVFREVRRVLRDDGTLWLNIGDSYASFRDGKATPDTTRGNDTGTLVEKGLAKNRSASTFTGTSIKHKDLIGIPWMLAFALRNDGWYLRQDIIWHKPNPMPESVTDRCTKAHEYIFLLTKSARYYYDAEAISESASGRACGNKQGGKSGSPQDGLEIRNFAAVSEKEYHTRNRRSVWTVTTKPFRGAHFATFPLDLITPCIKAGSAKGSTVLDPFNGAGTTGVACKLLGREYIGIELNPAYVAMAEKRIAETYVQGELL